MDIAVHAAEALGGLALFLYGMALAADGFRRMAGGVFGGLVSLVARNRPAALFAGASATLMFQSASATTAMLVSLANAGLLRAWQTLGIILGGCLGSAVTVQAIAFRFDRYALFVVAAAVPLVILPRLRRWRPAGTAVLGIGLLFFGMHLLGRGLGPLGNLPAVRDFLVLCGSQPLWGMLAGAVLTALLQSSTATAAIVLAMAQQGVLPGSGDGAASVVAAAIPFLLGAHAGSLLTAAIAALGASREAWRVVVGHALLRLTVAFLLLPLVAPLAEVAFRLALWMGADATRAVANAHTIFNVANIIIFLPFVGPLGRLIERLVPEGAPSSARLVRYLSPEPPPDVEAGLLEAARELRRLGETTVPLAGRAFDALETNDPGEAEGLRTELARLEEVHRALVRYLARLSSPGLSAEQAERQQRLLFLARDLRSAASLLLGELMHLAEEKAQAGVQFSMEGAGQLRRLHTDLVHDLGRTVRSLAEADADEMSAVVESGKEAAVRSREMALSHFERISVGVTEAVQTDAQFMRALAVIIQAHDHVAGMARTLLARAARGSEGKGDPPPPAPQGETTAK